MTEPVTTTRIYTKDLQTLIDRFGGPAYEAIRKAVNENCPHPEEKRSYLVADLPFPVQSASKERHTLGGFYCHDCGRYIFKAPTK